jgi:MoaD family protein
MTADGQGATEIGFLMGWNRKLSGTLLSSYANVKLALMLQNLAGSQGFQFCASDGGAQYRVNCAYVSELIKSHRNMPAVKFYANLRKIAGTKELSAAGTNLREVLSELRKQNPSLVDAVLEDGKLRLHVIITINGYNATDLNMSVSERDVIAIFPPIAGGASPLTPLPEGRGESRRMNGWLV